MQFFHELYQLLRHFDQEHFRHFVQYCGWWIHVVLFAIVFCETGLVVTPFLPGDSLLFLVGALIAGGAIDGWTALVVLLTAAVLGDTVNYQIGHYLGPKALQRNGRFLKKEYIDRTHRFFEKHGGKTIILARFIPIVRTFAPFVAGVGAMTYRHFLAYNVIGAVAWVALGLGAGYLFGQSPWVEEHFELVIVAIIVISVLPVVYEYWRHRAETARLASQAKAAAAATEEKP